MNELSQTAGATVRTVLGPLAVEDLGVIATHEALLSVLPGAEYAPDITIDRAEIFELLAAKLHAFREAGGGTIVDSTGMFHGRNVPLYEALARATGVNIIASTGLGPEENLGGYFLTPQTNPPTPWPAEKFEKLFAAEITEGMVVPRVERRGPAGLVTIVISREGITPTEEGMLRGSARAALSTKTGLSLRYGSDPVAELSVALSEGMDPSRVLVGGLDRKDAVSAGAAFEVARRGAMIGLDHAGTNNDESLLDDLERIALIKELVATGFGGQIIVSSNAIGVAKGIEPRETPFSFVLQTFVPLALSHGVAQYDLDAILRANPRTLLAGNCAQLAPASE